MQGFLPSIVAGAALTVALVRADRIELLAPTWLLLYGAGILAGATASISVLTWVGALFMVLGVAAVATVGQWPDRLARRGVWRAADRLRHHHHEEAWRLDAAERRTVTRHRSRPSGQARPNGRARRQTPAATRAVNLDRLIHDRTRLAIISALAASSPLTFTELKHAAGSVRRQPQRARAQARGRRLCHVHEGLRRAPAENAVLIDRGRPSRAAPVPRSHGSHHQARAYAALSWQPVVRPPHSRRRASREQSPARSRTPGLAPASQAAARPSPVASTCSRARSIRSDARRPSARTRAATTDGLRSV